MKQNILFLLAVTTLLTLSACGQSQPSLEEACTGSNCSEPEINAPVPGAEENNSSVDENIADNTEEPSIDDYRLPDFQSSWELSRAIYEKAIRQYEENRNAIGNTRYMVVIDFSQHSSKKRFYLFDLANGTVNRYLTSHGKNSDTDNDGYATSFSNQEGSLKSSLGLYLTLGSYTGSHGYSMRLRGLEETNSNAEVRAIVVHPADYVQEKSSYAGRSWGCPALDPSVSRDVINKIKNGSLFLIAR